MFGLGYQEIFVVLIVAVIVFGKNLPDVSRSIGKTLRQFQSGFRDLKEEVDIDRQDFKEALFEDPAPQEPLPDDGDDFQKVDDPWNDAEDQGPEYEQDCEEWALTQREEEGEEPPAEEPEFEDDKPTAEGEDSRSR